MTQEAIVTKTMSNGLAEVLVERGTACGDCGSCEVCRYTREIRTVAKNTLGAREGQRVIIQTKSSDIIGAAFLLYVVPLVVLLLGYLIADRAGAAELTCIAAAFIAFGVCVAVVTVFQRQRARKKTIEYEIVRYQWND